MQYRIRRAYLSDTGRIQHDEGGIPKEGVQELITFEVIHPVLGDVVAFNERAYLNSMRRAVLWLRGSVLEIGIGLGFTYKAIRDRGIVHDVVELDEDMTRIAQEYFPEHGVGSSGGTIYYGDYRTALKHLPDGCYGSILIDIEETPGDYFVDEAGAEELSRLLSPGGVVVSGGFNRTARSLRGFRQTGAEEVATFFGAKNYKKNWPKVFERQLGRPLTPAERKEKLERYERYYTTKLFALRFQKV